MSRQRHGWCAARWCASGGSCSSSSLSAWAHDAGSGAASNASTGAWLMGACGRLNAVGALRLLRRRFAPPTRAENVCRDTGRGSYSGIVYSSLESYTREQHQKNVARRRASKGAHRGAPRGARRPRPPVPRAAVITAQRPMAGRSRRPRKALVHRGGGRGCGISTRQPPTCPARDLPRSRRW